MRLTKAEIEQVAWLARLELTDEEKERLTVHLNQIMGYFERLQELDTTHVQPMSHSILVENVYREDDVRECMKPEGFLSSAPEVEDGYFVVPKVVES